jgi:hypothetical protein
MYNQKLVLKIMDFKEVLKFLLAEFPKSDIDFALVGGLAVSIYTKPRMTQDLDLMILSTDLNKAKNILINAGYSITFESGDIVTFVSKSVAKNIELYQGINVKVLIPEDIIGLKVQAYNNQPERYYKDMADIQELIKSDDCKNLDEVEEYFKIFDRHSDFKTIIKELALKHEKKK